MDAKNPNAQKSKGLLSRKTATAVRAIGRMTALRLFSNHKKSTGQDPLTSNDSTSLADLLKAKREEDANRQAQQEDHQQIEPQACDDSNIDLNDRDEPLVHQAASDRIVQAARPLERYQTEDSPPRRAIDIDTGGEADNTDESTITTPTVTQLTTTRDTLTIDTEAPFSNYGSDLTSSDRTSDFAEYDRASDHGLADFNSHTSDSEDMDIDVDNPAREVTDAATTIQAVYRGHRTRKRTYQPPAIHQDIRDCDVFEGSAARFDCRISGFPEPQVYWYKDGREIKENRHFRIEFEGEDLCSLIIREAGPDDEGVYKCEARNAAGVAYSEGELLVEVLGGDGSEGEDDGAPSEQSLGERAVTEDHIGQVEKAQHNQIDLRIPTDVTKTTDQQKQEEISLTNDFVTSPSGKDSQTSSNRSDFDYLSGGEKSSSDWTPRSSPCTSAGVSPSSSLLELDSWYKRGRGSNLEFHHQTSPKGSGNTGKVTERISRYDDRLKGPKQTVNSARASLRSTPGTDITSIKSRLGRASSGESDKPSYVASVERPSRLRLAELESKRKTRSSSEPPPEFQNQRDKILSRHSKPEQSKTYDSKASKNYPSRETYESAYNKLLKSSRVPSAGVRSASQPLKPQFATKISVFSGTGSNGKTDKISSPESKPDKKIYAGREIKVKSLPKVVVSREESHLKGRPIESIRVNHDRTNGRLSSDDSLTDSERSSTSSGYPESKKPVYRTEKTFELLGDRAVNSRKPGAVLAWKIEKFAKGSPLKSPQDLEAEKQQPVMQSPVSGKWNPTNGTQQKRSQSVDRALYPGQGGGSLAAKIEKFAKNTTSTQDSKSKWKTNEPVSSKKYEYSAAKVADKERKKDQKRPDVNYARGGELSSARLKYQEPKVAVDQPDQGTSSKLLSNKNIKLTKTTNEVPSTKQTTDSVINVTKGSSSTIDITIPRGVTEKTIKVSEATVVSAPPPEKKHQMPKGKTHGDHSSVKSLKPTEVEVVVKTTANDLSAGSSALITSVSPSKTSSLGKDSKENTSSRKPQASPAMNRRGVLPGGIGKLTAKFENGKAVDTSSKSPAKIESVVMSRLNDRKHLFDGTGKPKNNGNTVNYRDVLSSSSAGKLRNTTVSSVEKPAVEIAKSPVDVKAKSPSPLASRYQVKPAADEKPPTFTQKPRDQTGTEGGSIYFAVSVEGNPKPDLSWHYKGRTLKDEGRYELYTEKDVFFLEMFDLEPSDAGMYTCRLVNKVGRASAMAELKVTEKPKPVIPKGQAPSFVRRIADCEVCEGEKAVFECKVTGDPFPEITWIMDGKVVQEDRRHQITRKPDGTCALVVSDIREEDDAVYTCTAKNGLGMVSSTAELIVEFEAPKPQEPKKVKAVEKAPSKAQPKASMPRDEPKPVPKKEEKIEPVKLETKDVKRNGTVLKDETDSRVKKRDEEVHAEPPQNLHHQPRRSSLQSASQAPKPPEFILRPRSTHITPPETASFSCMVKGFPAPDVTWKKNTKVLKDEGRFEIYQDGGEHFLEIYDTVEEDAGRYTCVLANELGKTTSSANIALRGKVARDDPPKFTQRLTNCRTKDGGVARFSCRVSGEPAPTIQWLFLGKEISPDDDIYEIAFDGEKATLVLPEVLPEDEGEYECIARNRAGEASCRARLSVEIPPCEPTEPVEAALPTEPVSAVQAMKKMPWELQRKTSRTEIFLQTTPSESEEEVLKPKDEPKQEEQAKDVTEDSEAASSSNSEDELPKSETVTNPKEQVLDVEKDLEAKSESPNEPSLLDNQDAVDVQEDPRVELELVPDSEPILQTKPVQEPEELSVERSVADMGTLSVQIEANKNEAVPSSLDLQLELESESESEPEASLRIVESTQVKKELQQPERNEEPEVADIAPEMLSESHLDGLSEIEVSVAESQDLESVTDDKNVELVLGDAVEEPAIKAESKTNEESVPSVTDSQTKPEFLQTPSDVEVMDGSPLALTVKVKGTPEPEVMWIFDSCEILEDDDFKLLHDGELHSLVIREVYPEDAGVYFCKAFNAAGEDQCSAKIVVKDPVCPGSPPRFTQKPRSVTVDEGSSLRITCKVEGDPEPAISWAKDGRIISPGQRILMKKLGIGSSLRILQIPAALATDAGSYACTVSNSFGEEKCTVSVVVHALEEEQTDFRQLLKSRPRLQNINNNNTINSSTDKSSPESDSQQLDFRHVLTRHVQTKKVPKVIEGLKDMRIKEGELAVFQCRVEGTPKPTIAWTVDGREIKESKYFKMTTEGTLVKLTITEAFPEDEGEYSCIASNTAGQDKTTSDLKIVPWEEDENDDEEFLRSQVSSSKATSSPRDHLDEVFKRTLTISEDDDDVDADNPGTPPRPAITVTEASPKKSKKTPPPVPAKKTSLTRMRAPSFEESDSDWSGKAIESKPAYADGKVNIESHSKPQFTEGLCDRRIVEGKSAVLECRVTGEPEPDIFWYCDEVEIGETDPKYRYEFEGEHGVSLVVNNARMSDAGTYTCKAVNAAGTAESSAQLIAGVPAKIESGPKNIQVIAGQTLSISCQITGSPEPEVTWTKYRKEVEESERKHIDVTESAATLVIRQADEGDGGRYTLSVCNELGGDCFEISVSVVDKPDPPSGKPTASDVTRTSLTLSWPGPSYDGGSRILGYVIEMCRADDKKWENVTSTVSTSHVIADLEPEVEYLFRVGAENEHGVSEPSPVSDPVLTVVKTACGNDEKTGGESDEETEEFVVRGDVAIRTDKEVTELYDMKEQCGKGRFGVVYRCLEKKSGKQFAAKFIKIKSSDRQAVRSEIVIMNELHHPKLLQCVDAFEGPRQVVMVMEFIAGGELFERVIDDDFVLTEKDAIKFMRQICAGVHYMHLQNILHLDLKPENVMCVDTHGCRIKLIDFGLARKFDPTKSTKVMFGTPEFVAPEVINYEQISFATDLWSIGVICYILLSGLSPFMGDSDAETLNNVTAAEWDFEDEAFDDITDEAKEFIEKLLIKRKEKRQTVEECLQHKWLNKDIKTMKATQLSTAKLKKFVARRRWQKTTTAVRAIGRMASLTMFSGLKKANEQSPPCSPTHKSLLKSTLKKGLEDSGKLPLSHHKEEDDLSKKTREEVELSGKLEVEQTSPKVNEHAKKNSSENNNDDKTSVNDVNGLGDDEETNLSSGLQSKDVPDSALSRPPQITKQIMDATVFEGDCARFDCRMEGEPEPEVTWYQDDEEIQESRRFLIEQDDEGACSLIIKNVCEDDDAEYMVEAVSSAGKASSIAELIVHVPRRK
ncbi:myosin light chain kinase, smooth muscle-like isoform X3 [Patiria miniata]|uniref:Myosin light chain kinase, smooth muscle n=1 Tax=Patiria miniata TaxID=46514 RepID=A0A913Z5R2_PATMI|nr:myosin light chain kinase, smooth muscle-like isoform X3 [Patiria miniata]